MFATRLAEGLLTSAAESIDDGSMILLLGRGQSCRANGARLTLRVPLASGPLRTCFGTARGPLPLPVSIFRSGTNCRLPESGKTTPDPVKTM